MKSKILNSDSAFLQLVVYVTRNPLNTIVQSQPAAYRGNIFIILFSKTLGPHFHLTLAVLACLIQFNLSYTIYFFKFHFIVF